jgi:hypothetical protein
MREACQICLEATNGWTLGVNGRIVWWPHNFRMQLTVICATRTKDRSQSRHYYATTDIFGHKKEKAPKRLYRLLRSNAF